MGRFCITNQPNKTTLYRADGRETNICERFTKASGSHGSLVLFGIVKLNRPM